jgi:hypothetical protein
MAKFMKMTNADRIAVEAMIKFLTRLNVGVIMKKIETNKQICKALFDRVKTAPKELVGSSPEGAVKVVTKKLDKKAV